MKFINKILVVAIVLMFSTSCDNTELDLLDNPNAITPDRASLNDLYNNIQLAFGGVYGSAQGNPGAMSRMYTSVNFSYQAGTTPNTFNGLWGNAYSELFPDVDALVELSAENGFDIHAGTAKIMKAYTLMVLVDLFGSVPNSQALQGTDVISPAADPGDQIYASANTLLDEAITQLSGTSAAAPTFDNFYDGDPDKWITFAKTLKLKMALNTGDAGTINSIVSGGDLIDDVSEDFQINYGSQRNNPNSRHPFYNNHYEAGDGAYLSNYFMWLLRADKETEDGITIIDPRIRYYFYRKVEKADAQDPTTYSCHFSALPDQSAQPAHYASVDPRLPYCIVLPGDGYSGRDHLNGEGIPPDGPIRTSYGLYPGGGQFDFDEFKDTRQAGTTGGLGQGIAPMLLSSFVDFMRAEAAISLGTNDDPKALLESGIRASMNKVRSFESLVPGEMSTLVGVRGGPDQPVKDVFGMSDEDIDNYVTEVLGMYDRASSADERLDIVVKEFYIAAWGNGLEAYNMYRRTGKPGNMQPGLEPEVGNFPRSFFLPSNHVTRNSSVSQKDLGDLVFWDDGTTNVY